MVHYAVEVISKIWCFSLLITQGTLLNAFLCQIHDSKWWWWWSIADIVIITIWAVSLAILWKSFIGHKKHDHVDGKDTEQSPHEVKYAFFAWLVYVTFLTPRVLLIFLNFAEHRKKIEIDLLTIRSNSTTTPPAPTTEHHGNLLKVCVSITPLVYLSLMYGSHNAEPLTARKISIQSIAAAGTLDLFDSMDLLELLFEDEHGIPNAYTYVICFFASVNFFLPGLSLYDIRIQTVKGRVKSFPLKITNMVCVMGFVNLPNLSLRAVLWQKYDADVSVLIMKNVLCLTLGLYELAEYFGEKAPRECKECKELFDCTAFHNHEMKCSEQTIQLTNVHK